MTSSIDLCCEEDLLDDEFVCGMARADSRMQTAYASNHLMKKSEKEVDRKVDGNESERERMKGMEGFDIFDLQKKQDEKGYLNKDKAEEKRKGRKADGGVNA